MYVLPADPPDLPLAPVKPAPEPEDDDEIEQLDSMPQSVVTQPITTAPTTLKRGAPEDGDVGMGPDAPKKRKVDGEDPIVID
jgi:hypothetical protein